LGYFNKDVFVTKLEVAEAVWKREGIVEPFFSGEIGGWGLGLECGLGILHFYVIKR
jgi:hypothetical protein